MRASSTLFVVLALVAGSACEPELGSPCDNKEVVDQLVRQEPGKNDLVQSVRFDRCSAALCASVDGSRPFCTRTCETDTDCTIDDPAFVCAPIVQFGALGCRDFEDNPDCVDDDGSLSDSMINYCTTTRTHIEERDQTFGRAE
jgi:hypothetical protein